MPNDNTGIRKLDAARTAEEAAEKELIIELNRVRDICEERKKILAELKSKEKGLVDRLKNLKTERKLPALLMGEVSLASNVQAVSKIVSQELENCKIQLEQAMIELNRARDKELYIENELTEIRTKQKQIDKIVENRRSISRIISDATEEISVEDLLGSKKK